MSTSRGIGPIGTVSRVVVGAVLVFVSLVHGDHWGLAWYQAVLGLGVFPALMLGLGLVARHVSAAPLRFIGPRGTALNCCVILALSANPVTGTAVALFYGVTLLAAAWRGQPGCEATVIANLLLGRDDQVGCPVFSPLDAAERRRRADAPTPVGAER